MRPLLLAAAALLAAACSKSGVVGPSSTILLHYAAFIDGKLNETNLDLAPRQVTLGQGALPEAAEKALHGLRAGAKAFVEVPLAYGPYEESKVEVVPVSGLGAPAKGMKAGDKLLGMRGDRPAEARVKRVEGGNAWLDFNHPLAGKTVRFELTVVSIR